MAAKAGCTLCCLMLLAALLIGTVQLFAFSPSFYEAQHDRLGIAQEMGVPRQDLARMTTALLRYLKGDAPDIDCAVTVRGVARQAFDARERTHMEDVRSLYRTALGVQFVCLAAGAGGLLLLGMRRGARMRLLAQGTLKACLLVVLSLAALALWAVIDFNSFWTALHQLIFTNDLWLLDPSVSLMINMLPEQLFFALCMRIAAAAALGIALLAFCAALALRATNQQQE